LAIHPTCRPRPHSSTLIDDMSLPCHDDEPPARPELPEGPREERGELPLLKVVHDLLEEQAVVGVVGALHEAQPVGQERLDWCE
jgi:hypothetical protein